MKALPGPFLALILLCLFTAGENSPASPNRREYPVPLRAVVSPPFHGSRGRVFVVTGYCPCAKCCGRHACGLTASGKRAKPGMCAASRSIPFGTVLEIPGYGRAVVEDRLDKRFDARVDVFFTTHKAALAWGRQRLTITMSGKE